MDDYRYIYIYILKPWWKSILICKSLFYRNAALSALFSSHKNGFWKDGQKSLHASVLIRRCDWLGLQLRSWICLQLRSWICNKTIKKKEFTQEVAELFLFIVLDWRVQSTYTHTHIYIYIYIYISPAMYKIVGYNRLSSFSGATGLGEGNSNPEECCSRECVTLVHHSFVLSSSNKCGCF